MKNFLEKWKESDQAVQCIRLYYILALPITMKVYSLILLGIIIIACNNKPKRINTSTVGLPASLPVGDTVIPHAAKDVSLILLIANPEKYNKQNIRVIGYLHLGFEWNCLYLHQEDYKNAVNKNAIWVDVKTRTIMKSLQKYSGHYVLIEGTFDSNMHGHMGANSGSIRDITRLETWPYPKPKQ